MYTDATSHPFLSPSAPDAAAPQLQMIGPLLNASPHLVMVNDRAGRFLYSNAAAAQWIARDPEAIQGRTYAELGLPPEIVEQLDREREQVFATGLPVSGEILFPTSPGPRSYEYCYSPIADSEGALYATLCIARDVTERRQAEKNALHEAESRGYLIAEAMPQMVWTARPDGMLEFCNQRLIDYTGLSLQEAQDLGWDAVIHPADLPAMIERWRRATQTGEPHEIEFRLKRVEDDAYRWHLTRALPIKDAEGVVLFWVGTNTDIHDRKLADQENVRIQAVLAMQIAENEEREQELERANTRLERSMRETHHRVKNNLQLIAAMLDMATLEHPDALPRSEVDRLSHQIMTLAGIHDILTNTARALEGHTDEISSRVVLNRLLEMLEATAERRRFTRTIEEAVLTIRQATSLALVASELVSNALKHGRNEVRATFLNLGREGLLVVEDDGPGFPAGANPLVRANTGLTLVDNLTRLDLSGALQFENRIEGGARVRILFPLVRPEE